MYTVYLGLGSNLGNRLANLSLAIEKINGLTPVQSVSSIYETEPVAMQDAGVFYNMAVGIQTTDDPPLLLTKLKQIEKKMGRKVSEYMEPRIIDIDILLYRGLAYDDNMVRVPHPMLEHRRFALEPLHEIAPTAVHPILEKTVATLLRNCRDRHTVARTDLQLHVTSLQH
ncbi:MAG TPA: 2-amino-4-hydroxy-6-hydroxymethyldihydropteridine diphosphokinase [Bacteroidota bacterium]|nr:2-amino-4-hydroxy-6-hydroxymethyldihydropteridine diphosphokinase [Bacteroidota bacterium]